MKIATILLCIVTILSFALGTVCYVTNVGDCRVHVSSWDDSVRNWSIIDNMCDPFSFEAGLFWDLGLILLVVSGVFIYICVKRGRTTPKKEMSPIQLILILSVAMIVSIALVVIGLSNDIMWLAGIGLLGACVTFLFVQTAWRANRYQKMSDERLIELFQKYATDIQTALSVGGGHSAIVTKKVNSDIQNYREKGTLIGSILEDRGYTVNYSVLSGEVRQGKSKSDIGAIIKGAVVGGIIAGDVGAVIGAAHAMNKNNKK